MAINRDLKPATRPFGEGQVITTERFRYQCSSSLYLVDLPEGFVFDGASIPRAFWSTTGSPFMPKYIGAGLVHDALYRYAMDATGKPITRKLADQIFVWALKRNGVGSYQRWKIYNALRAFGGAAWKKHRKKAAQDLNQSIRG